MKKLTAIVLMLSFCMALIGCSNETTSTTKKSSTTTSTSESKKP